MMAGGAVNFFQPGTEAAVDANSILRQRKMAELLMQQSQQGQQSQMVSGHYVAPSKLSYVTQIAQALAGRYLGDQADSKEAELGHQLRQRNADEASQFTQAMQGAPARSEEMAGPPSPDGAMPSRQIAAVPGDQNRALAIALGSQNPQLQALAPEIIKRQMDAAELRSALQSAGIGAPAAPAAGGTDSSGAPPGGGAAAPSGLPDGISPQAFALALARNPQAQALGKMIQEANKPQTLAEGGTLVTPGGKIIMTAPKTEAGISVQGGRAAPIPGFADAQAQREGMIAEARQNAESKNTMVTVKGPDGRDHQMTRSQFIGMAGAPQPAAAGPGYAGGSSASAASGQREIYTQEMGEAQTRLASAQRAGDAAGVSLAQSDIAGIQREMGRLPGAANGIPGIAGPSAAILNSQEADKARQVNTAKSDVERDNARQTDIKTANKFLNITERVKDAFSEGPTDSAIGSAADATAAFFGKSTKGAESAQRLKALGGWLVANVPRMEGPQSNFDVENYRLMAADVANDRLPLPRRRAALDSIEKMMQDVASGKQLTAPAPRGKSASIEDLLKKYR